jgi:3-hydroxybutyryl-CoA dehydrogenase
MSTIKKVGVVGAGFMGTGIAQVSATAGYEVLLHDSQAEAMEKSLSKMRSSLDKLKAKGTFRGNTDEVMARVRKAESLKELAGCDLVIEAVYESVSVKQELLEELVKVVRPDALVSSNTSSIPMESLSEKVPNPQRFIGTHFFGPVPMMSLVELVLGPETSEATLEAARDFARKVGKTPVVVRKPSPGFLVNRIFFAAALEALRCLSEGIATPEDIDAGMRLGYGWAAGPFEVMDGAGVDVMAAVFMVLGLDPPPQVQEMLEKGWLGRKTGRGFYEYGSDGKKIIK